MLPGMTNRRKAAFLAAGMVTVAVLTGCSENGAALDSWCDRGNRMYKYFGGSGSPDLEVIRNADDCPQDGQEESDRPEGDTRPMPVPTAIIEGPYKPWKPAPKPGPKVNPPKVVTPKVAPRKMTFRLSPEVR